MGQKSDSRNKPSYIWLADFLRCQGQYYNCFYYCGFVACSEPKKCETSSFVLLLYDCFFGYLGSFEVTYEFEGRLSISKKKNQAEAEAPILWLPDEKNWLGKDPDAGKDWRHEKGMTEDEVIWWYHWLNGHEFEQAPGVDDRQGNLACCSPGVCKESNMTEWLNWTES